MWFVNLYLVINVVIARKKYGSSSRVRTTGARVPRRGRRPTRWTTTRPDSGARSTIVRRRRVPSTLCARGPQARQGVQLGAARAPEHARGHAVLHRAAARRGRVACSGAEVARGRVAATPRPRRLIPWGTRRGDAAAATWIVRGDEWRRRRGRDVETGARLRYPLTAGACGLLWNVGRVVYGYGYATGGPAGRQVGGLITHLGDFPLQLALFRLAYDALTTW